MAKDERDEIDGSAALGQRAGRRRIERITGGWNQHYFARDQILRPFLPLLLLPQQIRSYIHAEIGLLKFEASDRLDAVRSVTIFAVAAIFFALIGAVLACVAFAKTGCRQPN